MVGRIASARDAWQRLYAKRGLQYGGSADVKALSPFLRKDALILDAGCGDGKMTEAIARTSDVVGCDFSREALQAIRTQRDIEGHVNLVECNITDLPFESEKFDVVVCAYKIIGDPDCGIIVFGVRFGKKAVIGAKKAASLFDRNFGLYGIGQNKLY